MNDISEPFLEKEKLCNFSLYIPHFSLFTHFFNLFRAAYISIISAVMPFFVYPSCGNFPALICRCHQADALASMIFKVRLSPSKRGKEKSGWWMAETRAFSFPTRAHVSSSSFSTTGSFHHPWCSHASSGHEPKAQKNVQMEKKLCFRKVAVAEIVCLRIEKSNFPSARRFYPFLLFSWLLRYIALHTPMIERCREKRVSRGRIVEQQKRRKVSEDNGKSNFCITKHFTLCVLQVETLPLRGLMGRSESCYSCPRPEANEIQKYKRTLGWFFA